jgi:hypothetical protein
MVGNVRQIERLISSFSPARCSANSFSQNAADCALVEPVEPGARHVSSRHSTIWAAMLPKSRTARPEFHHCRAQPFHHCRAQPGRNRAA